MDKYRGKKIDETMEELDLRLGGLLGKLGDTLREVVDRLEAGEDGEVRRVHDIPSSKGPLRAETGVRVRVGGIGHPGDRSGTADARGAAQRDPARPVNADMRTGSPGAAPTGASRPQRQDEDSAEAASAAGPLPWQGAAGSGSDCPSGPPGAAEATPPPRCPHLEAFAEAGRWRICADLPGVSLPEVDVRIETAETAEAGAEIVVQTDGARRYAFRHPLPEAARPDDMQIVLRNGVLDVSIALAAEDQT